MQKILKFSFWILLLICSAIETFATTFSTPEAGKVYRIWNTGHPKEFMYANGSRLLTKTSQSTDYSDLFLLEAKIGVQGGFVLRNIASGMYVGSVSANETIYPLGSSIATFIIRKNNSRSDNECYNILHSDDQKWSMHDASGQRVVRWYPTSSGSVNKSSEWQFEDVEFTQPMKDNLAKNEVVTAGVYHIINDQRRKGTNLYASVSASKKVVLKNSKPVASTYEGYFVVRPMSEGRFAIQDLKSGLFVQNVESNNTVYSAGNQAYGFFIEKQTKVTKKSYWDIYNSKPTGNSGNDWCWHADGSTNVVRWHPYVDGGNQGLSPSEWILERNTSLSDDEVRQRLAQFSKASIPTAGKYYRIVSNAYNRALYDNYASDRVSTQNSQKDNYLELWEVVKSNNNTYNLKNVVTGKYLQKNNAASSNYKMATSQPSVGFTLKANTIDPYSTLFEVVSSENIGIHCGANQGYDAVAWYVGNEGNIWIFQEEQIDNTKLSEQKSLYESRTDIIKNASKYGVSLSKYFVDNSCTELKSEYKEMADEQLLSDMTESSLPISLKRIVLKLRNSQWQKYASGRNWEQRFRIANYKPYSDYRQWPERLGLGYEFGSMTGPTGVTALADSTIFVFVDNIPSNSTVEAELVPLGTKNGSVVKLKKGFNAILSDVESNVFIRYNVDTYNNSLNNRKGYMLADFPEIKVHIEGGRVNGYFDVTKGDNNKDWQTMQSDGLCWAKSFNMKTEYIVFNMPGADLKKYTPIHLTELLAIWDNIPRMEQEIMGFRKDWKGRFNCVLNATAVDHGYMYASTGGTYYNYNTLSSVLSYTEMNKRNGVLWGPAHEFGHNHQKLFNMAGMTEISNNVFSNAVLFNFGKVTSRAGYSTYKDIDGKTHKDIPESKVSRLADNFSMSTDWIDYGIWGCTQMMYKLYLYYHAAGNDTLFYNKVFHLMMDSPMTKQKTRECTGATDYLKFAVTCSKAAGEDLSDFFQSWGFFHPIVNKTIGDYGITVVNTTQQMIDEALAEMHKYPKKGSNNLLFIDDHIRPTKAIYPGHQAGEMRQNYDSYNAFGKMGDMGNWDQFCPDSQGVAKVEFVKEIKNNDGSVTYVTRPKNGFVVGYKVYDGNGNLIYFANERTFTVPKKVMEKAGGNVSVIACSSNGAEQTIFGNWTTAIQSITAEATKDEVDVYDINGRVVRHRVSSTDALVGLPKGIYVVGKKKIMVE